MRISRSYMVVLLWMTSSVIVYAQKQVTQVQLDPVTVTVKKRSNSMASYEYNQLFALASGNYLYVRSYHTGLLIPSYHKANAFLFDANGKLISSNTDMMDKGEMGEDRILDVVQVGDQVILITIKDESKLYTCKFWDITQAGEPKKVKQIEIIKSSTSESYPKIKTSPNGNFLLLVSGHAHNVVVIDKEFETAYSKNLIPSKNEGGNKANYIDACEVDDEGYVSLSIFLEEAAGFFSASSGSWIFLGIDIVEDEIIAWNLAEVWNLSRYTRGNSEIKTSNDGKVAFSYTADDTGKGFYNLYAAIFDLKEGKLVGTASIDNDLLQGRPRKGAEYVGMRNEGVYFFEDGQIAAVIYASGAKSSEYVILLDNECKLRSYSTQKFRGYSFSTQSEIAFVKGNTIWFPRLMMPENVPNIGKDTQLGLKHDVKKAVPTIVSYDNNTEEYGYRIGQKSLKPNVKNDIHLLTEDGLVAFLEFKGKNVTIKLHDLKQKK